MKYVALLISVVVLLQAGSASAGYCRELEYAEVKDMSTEDLVWTYCNYEKRAQIERDLVDRYLDLYARSGARRDVKEKLDELMASIKGCNAQLGKIETALKARGRRERLTCEQPTH